MVVSIVAFIYDELGVYVQRRVMCVTHDVASLKKAWADCLWEVKNKKLRAHFFTVVRSNHTPKPWKFDLSDGRSWCPYCRDGREFFYDEEWDLWRCPVCEVSSSDFYVRRCNGSH